MHFSRSKVQFWGDEHVLSVPKLFYWLLKCFSGFRKRVSRCQNCLIVASKVRFFGVSKVRFKLSKVPSGLPKSYFVVPQTFFKGPKVFFHGNNAIFVEIKCFSGRKLFF